MTFQWIKGHNGTIGNEESDCLARQGANKQDPDVLDLNVPIEFDLNRAKLTTLTQAKVYQGIQRSKEIRLRNSTIRNLQLT